MWSQVGLRKYFYKDSGGNGIPAELLTNPKRRCSWSAALNMSANSENSAVATELEEVSFYSNPKERRCQKMLNYQTIVLISHASKAKLQQYVNQELPDVQAGFRKEKGTREQTANICWSQRKQGNYRKTYASLTTLKLLTVWITTNWKILKEIGIRDHLTCVLRNLYAGQEATIRTGHWTADWFKIRKGVRQDCTLSPCLFNLHAEYIMQNARVDES